MSSYVMTDLRGKIGVATDTVPLVYEASVDASEISALTIAVICTAVSGGVGVLTPATVGIEHSFDDGLTWVALSSLNGGVITGAGTFLTSVTLNTGLVAPIIRVTITAPAGESITVSKVSKNRFLPGTLISFAGTSFLGGSTVTANNSFKYGAGGVFADTFATYDTTTPTNNRGAPSVTLAGQGLGPLDVGAGATTALTRRVAITTDSGLATQVTAAAILAQLDVPSSQVARPLYTSAYAPVSGLALVLVANTWLQFIASTSAASKRFQYINQSGYAIELGIGGAGAEVSVAVLADAGEIDLSVPAGTRISIRCATGNTLPVFWLAAYT